MRSTSWTRRAARVAMAACVVQLSAVAAAEAAPGGEPTVAVVIAGKINVDDQTARAMATAIATALQSELAVQATADEKISASLDAAQLPSDCLADEACRIRAVKSAQADQMLMLVFVQVGDSLKVEATWIDVNGKAALRDAFNISPASDQLQANLASKATVLLPEARKRDTVGLDGPTVPVETAPTGGNEASDASATTDVTGGLSSQPGTGGSGRHMTTASWVFLGAGAAMLIPAGYASFKTRRNYLASEDCKGGAPCTTERLDEINNPGFFENPTNADIIWTVSLGCLATAGILYYLSDGDDNAPAETVTVGITGAGDGMGVSLGGRF